MMSLSADEETTLADLKTAHTKLISGQQVARVGSGTNIVEFAKGDIDKCAQEIARLEAKKYGRRGGGRGAIRFRVL